MLSCRFLLLLELVFRLLIIISSALPQEQIQPDATMLSLIDILLLVLCAQSTHASPLLRSYWNTTAADSLVPTGVLFPSPDRVRARLVQRGRYMNASSTLTAASTSHLASSSLAAAAQMILQSGAASYSEPCDSMSTSSITSSSIAMPSSANRQLAYTTSSAISPAGNAPSHPAPSTSSISSIVVAANTTMSGPVSAYGVHHAVGAHSTHSATTLTFYTTVYPGGDGLKTRPYATVHGTQSTAGSPSFSFTYAPTSSIASRSKSQRAEHSTSSTTTLTFYTTVHPGGDGGKTRSSSGGFPTQSITGSQSLSLSHAATSSVASRSETKETEYSTSSTSTPPAIWGSYTLTYAVSSSQSTVSTARSPSTKSTSSWTAATSTATATIQRHSSAFAYPTPSSSTENPATVDPIHTTASAPPPVFTWSPTSSSGLQPLGPPYQSTDGLPSIITQPSPTSSATSLTTSTSSSGIAGITIVPVNTDATTIYITVTTTDPGATTTVAKKTVTANPH